MILHWPRPLLGSTDFLLDFWYFLFFKILFLLVVPGFVFWRLGYRFQDLIPGGLTRRDWLWSAVAYSVGFAINLAHMDAIRKAHVPGVPWRIALAVAIALFNAGIPEEFVFRGWMQTRMEQRYGRLIAVTGTALLFTAWHIPSRYFLAFGEEGKAGDLGSVLLGTGVPVLIVALILGVLWDRYRRLLPLIALHWGIDTLPLIAGLLNAQS
ncbi:MAG TPA: CPBP family intramembrane glutamic endopeptidase [Bryobacteraceae bacterium]|nr:CPBP family intramembrane glutamic endopeptidase [Bryobacteraceae bacterium]